MKYNHKITKIYLVTNCFGDPNKVYIGKTKNSTRENDHKKKFGKDIIYTYIDEINSYKKEDWEPLETFWIEYFRQLGFELQNKRMKGGSGPEFYSEETCLKMSLQRIGKPIHSEENKLKISQRFTGFKHSEESRNKISQSKLGRKHSEEHKSKLIGKKRSEETKQKMRKPKSLNHKLNAGIGHLKKVYQYDLEGNFIKEWDSQLNAENFLTNKNKTKSSDYIGSCCRGIRKSAFGYIWKYEFIQN